MDKPIIVIAGATATGKTELAVNLAEIINGEVISADSMQIYKYMDIGTAKPTKEEMRHVPHYMIDEVYPDACFSVASYKSIAEKYISLICSKGKIPIVAGGSGFYINALIKDTDFNDAGADEKIRAYYSTLAKEKGDAYIYELLVKEDAEAASCIHPNNIKRVIRALEYINVTGESISAHNKREREKWPNANVKMYILDMNRSKLYEKINKRVDIMIEKGLINEVQGLLDRGYSENLTSMQGIGYKEIVKHLRGEYSLLEAIDKIKQGSRNYAKRQITWFKHQTNGVIISAGNIEAIVGKI